MSYCLVIKGRIDLIYSVFYLAFPINCSPNLPIYIVCRHSMRRPVARTLELSIKQLGNNAIYMLATEFLFSATSFTRHSVRTWSINVPIPTMLSCLHVNISPCGDLHFSSYRQQYVIWVFKEGEVYKAKSWYFGGVNVGHGHGQVLARNSCRSGNQIRRQWCGRVLWNGF